MAIRVTSLLMTSPVALPVPVGENLGPRLTKDYPFVEYDKYVNDERVVNLLKAKAIRIENLDELDVGYDAPWDGPRTFFLEPYQLWIDPTGLLRSKSTPATSPFDGNVVGGGGTYPVGPTPPATPSAGDIWYNTAVGWNMLMHYDAVRSKWLSEPTQFCWGHDNANGNALRGSGINVPSAGSGVLLPRSATVTRISALARTGNATKQFDLHVNTIPPAAAALSFSLAALKYKDNVTNLDLSEDDSIWMWAAVAGATTRDVTVRLWVSWRWV